MGAVASGGIRTLNRNIVEPLHIPDDIIDRVARREQLELDRQQQAYRHGRVDPAIANRILILVDDGLATGSTMRAAVEALRNQQPKRIVVAVPVGAAESCAELRSIADEVVCRFARGTSIRSAAGTKIFVRRPMQPSKLCSMPCSNTPTSHIPRTTSRRRSIERSLPWTLNLNDTHFPGRQACRTRRIALDSKTSCESTPPPASSKARWRFHKRPWVRSSSPMAAAAVATVRGTASWRRSCTAPAWPLCSSTC